ncbi:glycosyltransferase family 2 protein [Nocardioides sp. Kera G14]|uniref:glycosyltransferase family 2 protein n=1 Tax=Nocardioides sp. Kera G14 TaxID=2884264 RepID=UPI001D10EC6A|nr:glycosyltransferase family 2 protein [Nocardioides sp. Kera G14]UDY24923.1 glycosyltransferase family 2 protein [Nocardioides sp. Kera G14]
MDLSICICTFRRPDQLRELLVRLGTVDLGEFQVEVVVVDNETEGTGLAVVDELAPTLRVPVVTRHVTVPNIAVARNAAVRAASGRWLLFIDDDELPVPDWVVAMLRTQATSGADAVFGPVLARYDDPPPAWLENGERRFWGRPRHRTGDTLPVNEARAGNVLVSASLLARRDGPFDPAFGVTGGEDAMLFWELARSGACFVWCDEAEVSEQVPASRRSLTYVLRRGFSGGQSYARVELARLRGTERMRRAASLLCSGLWRLPVAALLALVALPQDRARAVHWLRVAYAQAGKIGAVVGQQTNFYAT